jgi:hypothetical protein
VDYHHLIIIIGMTKAKPKDTQTVEIRTKLVNIATGWLISQIENNRGIKKSLTALTDHPIFEDLTQLETILASIQLDEFLNRIATIKSETTGE